MTSVSINFKGRGQICYPSTAEGTSFSVRQKPVMNDHARILELIRMRPCIRLTDRGILLQTGSRRQDPDRMQLRKGAESCASGFRPIHALLEPAISLRRSFPQTFVARPSVPGLLRTRDSGVT